MTICDTFWGSHGCDLDAGHEGPCLCDHRDLDEDGNPVGTIQDCYDWEPDPGKPPYYGPDTRFHSNNNTPTPPQTLAASLEK